MRKRNAFPALDLLVGFEAAARHLSFTKAGEELFLTQSAVSRQIKELEDQLGAALFQRRHRALALTDAGQQFYAASAQAIATMRAATERIRSSTGSRTVSITTTASFAALWLVPRLAGFTRAQKEGVDVRISTDTRVVDLERDGFDIAIRHGGSYYLTYHRWARRDQVEQCYLQMRAFLQAKQRYDLSELFQSEWYRCYRAMFP